MRSQAGGRMGSVKSGGCLPDFKVVSAGFVIQVVIFFSDKQIQPVKSKKNFNLVLDHQ